MTTENDIRSHTAGSQGQPFDEAMNPRAYYEGQNHMSLWSSSDGNSGSSLPPGYMPSFPTSPTLYWLMISGAAASLVGVAYFQAATHVASQMIRRSIATAEIEKALSREGLRRVRVGQEWRANEKFILNSPGGVLAQDTIDQYWHSALYSEYKHTWFGWMFLHGTFGKTLRIGDQKTEATLVKYTRDEVHNVTFVDSKRKTITDGKSREICAEFKVNFSGSGFGWFGSTRQMPTCWSVQLTP